MSNPADSQARLGHTDEDIRKSIEEMKAKAAEDARIWEAFHRRGGWGASAKKPFAGWTKERRDALRSLMLNWNALMKRIGFFQGRKGK